MKAAEMLHGASLLASRILAKAWRGPVFQQNQPGELTLP